MFEQNENEDLQGANMGAGIIGCGERILFDEDPTMHVRLYAPRAEASAEPRPIVPASTSQPR